MKKPSNSKGSIMRGSIIVNGGGLQQRWWSSRFSSQPCRIPPQPSASPFSSPLAVYTQIMYIAKLATGYLMCSILFKARNTEEVIRLQNIDYGLRQQGSIRRLPTRARITPQIGYTQIDYIHIKLS